MTTLHQDTLLVIDDTPDNVNLLLKFLTAAGFKVLIAQDGEEGIETAEYALPDLILLDVMMPGMDGFEVCQHLKSQENTQEIPIIFMTALTETVKKIRGFELGAADYITKPLQHEEVLARVNAHLNLRKLQQQLAQRNQQLQEQTEQLQKEIRIRQETEVSLQNSNKMLAERTVELQARTEELEQRNQELDAFAHTVAHDLKNPLTGITALSSILVKICPTQMPSDAEFVKNLQLITQTGQRAFNIIDALLLLAGVSKSGQVTILPLDMSQMVAEVIEQRLADLVTKHQAQIDKPNTWPKAQGYAPWVEEIWINYLSNGLKYGGEPPHLELGADIQNDGMIRFWVRDNGKGLTPEEQAQLFTPFTRLHLKRVEGHGLGLSIVRQIVEKLGGQAGVESEIGQGSVFYFTLPRDLQNAEEANR